MTERPTIVMLHSVYASHAHDEEAERAAIEARVGGSVPMARSAPESLDLIADAEIALCSGITTDQLEAAERLRWVQAFTSGVDFYPVERMHEKGVVFTNAAGIHAQPIAEQVLGYMLLFSRRLHRGVRQQYESRWERYEGDELKGKTVGILGVGAVGTRLAEFVRPLGMRTLGVKRTPETAPDAVDEVYGPNELFEVLPRADYLVVACPLTDETRGLIGDEEIEAMPNSAVLINIARGPIVDYDRLLVALQKHEIRGAGLDVFPEEPFDHDASLWDLPNVVMTPHMAGSSPRKPERIAAVFEENYQAFLDGEYDAMPTRIR